MTHPTTAPAAETRARECQECGADLSDRHRSVRFCGPAHRLAFKNRRYRRGAELYDLKMAERFERGHPRSKHLLSIMNRLCAQWRDEDFARRGGRKSWGDWVEWLARNVWALPTTSRPYYDGIVHSSGTVLKR